MSDVGLRTRIRDAVKFDAANNAGPNRRRSAFFDRMASDWDSIDDALELVVSLEKTFGVGVAELAGGRQGAT